MIVISFGMRKSGSTLGYRMAGAVLELSGFPQVQLPDGVVEPGKEINVVRFWSDGHLSRLLDASEGQRIVVKTHTAPGPVTLGVLFDAIEAGNVRINVIFRDPRDTVLSILDHAARSRASDETPFKNVFTIDDAVRKICKGLTALWQWSAYPSLKLLYDDFAFDPVRGPMLIAEQLGVSVDPQQVWARLEGAPTKKNVAMAHRHRSQMAADDAARIASELPEYVELVESHARRAAQASG
jgi:hypothetical protein